MKDQWHCDISGFKAPSGENGEVSLWLLGKLKELEDLRYYPHPFNSVSELFEAFKYQPPRKRQWRLTKFELGQIRGLPMSRGRIAATDGILCVIITATGIYEGHISAFEHEFNLDDVIDNLDDVIDREPASASNRPIKAKKPTAAKVKNFHSLDDFLSSPINQLNQT